MLSDLVCNVVRWDPSNLISQGLLCEFFTFLISRPAEAHHTAAYILQSSKGYPLVNAKE